MIAVRSATAADAATLCQLALDARVSGWTEAVFAEARDTPGREVLVAEYEGRSAGFCAVQQVLDEVELLLVVVAPFARRRGVGRALMDRFEGQAAERGADRVHLEVADDNAPARALYSRRGYAEVGRRRRYYRDGRDAIAMTKTL